MKTKRRHELQTNQLADALGHLIDAVKPYASWIGLAVVAAAAIGIATYVINNRNTAGEGAAWANFFAAQADRDADQLRQVAEQSLGEEAAFWALLSVGDIELDNGVSTLLVDRDESSSSLKDAKNAYESVVKVAPAKSMVRQRAMYGLAQAHESLGELPEAKKYYEQLAKDWPDTMIGNEAQKRLNAISEKSTVDWYAYLAQYEPPKRTNVPGLPGADRDLFNMDLPEGPTSPFSTLNEDLDSAPNSTSTPDPGSTFTPAGDDASESPAASDENTSSEDAGNADAKPTSDAAPASDDAAPATPAADDNAATPPAEDSAAPTEPADPQTSDAP